MSQKSIDIYMGHDIGSHANPIRACPIGIQANFEPTNGSRPYLFRWRPVSSPYLPAPSSAKVCPDGKGGKAELSAQTNSSVVVFFVCSLAIPEISTLTHPRTSQQHGEGQAEDCGQFSHMRIMAKYGRDRNFRSISPYETAMGQVKIPLDRRFRCGRW